MATGTRATWMDAWGKDLVPSDAARRSAARVQARSRSTRYYGREATAHNLAQEEHEAHQTKTLPELKVVRRRRPQWGVILVSFALLGLLVGVSIVVPMLVSAATTEIESAVGELETRQQQVAAAASALSAQVSGLSSPERITEQAVQLGLVPAQSVHYVQVGGGAAAEGDTTVAGR